MTLMKKVIYLLSFAVGLMVSLTGLEAQERYIRVYSNGEVVYNASTTGSNRLTFSGSDAVFTHNGVSWTTTVGEVDSLVFYRGSGEDTNDVGGGDTVSVDTAGAVYITWNGTTVDVVNPFETQGVTVTNEGGDVSVVSTIDSAYIPYILRGTSQEGSLTISTVEKVFLRMDNLSLASTSGPAILIASDKKAVFELAGTSTLSDNALSNGKGALQSVGKIAFQGEGTLNVSGLAKHGIQSSGSCTVNGGTVNVVSAVKDGMNVDNFYLYDGVVSVTGTGGDGVDGDQGHIEIYGGRLTVVCTADDAKGLCCDSTMTIAGGTVDVTVNGVQSKGIKTKGLLVVSGGSVTVNAGGTLSLEPVGAGYDPSYCTGIKVGGNALFVGGETTVVCASTNAGGKAVSADGNITLAAGTLSLSATGACAKYMDSTGAYDSYASACLKANGNIAVSGGTLTATAGGRAITCDGIYTQTGGRVTTTTNAAGFTTIGSGTSCSDGFAPACLKADGDISITAGVFSGTSTGKGGRGIVSNGSFTAGTLDGADSLLRVYVSTSGATVNSTTNSNAWKGIAKGIKIEGNITINSGYVQSYCSQTSGDPTGEAIESKDSIFIHGGYIEANAYDDPINTAVYYEQTGGYVWAYSRHNDAVDCNGTMMRLSGGVLIAIGSECAIDNNREESGQLEITGGTIVAIGGSMGAIESAPTCSGTQKGLTWGSAGGGGPWGGGGGSGSSLATNGFCVKTSSGSEVLTFKMPTVSGSGFYTPEVADYGPGGPGGGPGGSGTSAIYVSSPDIVSGTYYYYSSPTVSGGSHWHGLYSGATVTTSGSGTSVTAQ